MANFYAQYPASSGGSSNASVGLNGAPAPTSSTEIGFIDGSGNETAVSPSTPLPVTVISGPNPQNVNLTQVGGAAITEGQKVMAASIPVAIASDQSAIPISASALPLPAGASTAALQTTGNTSLASILANQTNATQKEQIVDGSGNVVGPAQALSGTNYLPVVLASSATPGSAAVARSVQIAGTDGTNARTVSTDSTGKLNVNVASITPPADVTPATQNITVVDSVSATTAQANGQNVITGTPTAGSAASFAISSEQAVEAQVTGTWTGTLSSEVSFDSGVTWFTRGLKLAGSSYLASTYTQNFEGGANITAATNYRIRATSAITGTAVVKITISENQGNIVVTNPLTLRDATTQSITNTIKAASTAAVATDTALVVAISPNSPVPITPPAAAIQQAFSLSSATSQAYNCSQYSTLSINVTSAGTSNIFVFEATNDNVNWEGVLGWPVLGGTANSGGSGVGTWAVNVSAFQQFRIRIALYGTGTVAGVMFELPAGQVIPLGQQAAIVSTPVTLSNENIQDLYVIGATAQTAIVNNALTSPAGAASTDLTGYRSASVQVLCNATGGTFIFEGSNDNSTFIAIPVYNQVLATGVPIVAAITATVSSFIYTFPVNVRYIRLRVATTLTGGTGISPFSKFMQMNWTPAVFQVANNTSGNLLTTTTLSAGGVVASAFNNLVADVASAAIITTTTTAAITPTQGLAYTINIPVTIVSGTNPTLAVAVQESSDNGNNWYTTYTFPTMTATGSYNSPMMIASGTRVRYVQTVGGTSPSFTRTINRVQSTTSAETLYRKIIDTSIDPTTTNSTTAVLVTENSSTYTAIVNQGAGGSAVTFAMDGSIDNVVWVSAIATCVGVIGGATPVSMFYSGANYSFIRVRVVTGVASTTISSISISGSAASHDQTPSVTGSVTIIPSVGSFTDGSGNTSATPSTSTQIFAANATRKYLLIQNLSTTDKIYIKMGASATTTSSIVLGPDAGEGGGSFVMESSFVNNQTVNVLCASASQPFMAEQA